MSPTEGDVGVSEGLPGATAAGLVRVLLVGGDGDALDRARSCLTEWCGRSFEVDLACDLEAGIQRARGGRVDAVLIDPRRSGAAARVAIDRLAREVPAVPVVACGLKDDAEVLEALGCGVDETVVEGDRRSLSRSVLHALERHRLKMRLEEAARRLAASDANLRAILDASVDGIAVLSADEGRVLFTNPAAERLLGGGAGLAPARVAIPAASGAVTEIVRPDGTPAWLEVRSAPVRWEGHAAVLVGLRDVTDLHHAERHRRESDERLRQAQRMEAVGMLAGGLAHDFNNLLTVVLGASQLLRHRMDRERETTVAKATVAGNLELIDKAAQRAAVLTRQLLAISRRQLLQPRLVDLNALLGEMEPLLRSALGEHVALALERSDRIASVLADPGNLEQVVMNLSVNARDAMPRGGRLAIATADVRLDEAYAADHAGVTPGDYVLLSVADTGTGIDPETLKHVFEPFFSTKGPGLGTGLGLSIVYGIVKQTGGHVAVESVPGQGSTFRVYLPRAREGAASAAEPPETDAPAGGTETVLLVEDEAALRGLARETLEIQGYRVLEAAGGEEALEIARAHATIHCLATDVVMPGMGGQELSERFQRLHPEAAVLFTSGFTDSLMVDRGLLRRGTAYLQKPYTPVQLARRVRAVLDERRGADRRRG